MLPIHPAKTGRAGRSADERVLGTALILSKFELLRRSALTDASLRATLMRECLADEVSRMKLLLPTLLLASSVLAQGRSDPSLVPFRSAAHKAFTEEMARADQPLCPNLVALPEFSVCLNALLQQSENDLAAYRTALRSSIAVRQKMLGAQSLNHFRFTERMWDLYSASQLKASGDMAEGPELVGSAEEETRIDLIRSHMRMLDHIYYTLLHDDCGACFVDH